MRLRRKRILSVLRHGEVAPTMTCFPLMGVGDFVSLPEMTTDHTVPSRHASSSGMHVRGPVANSAYVPDVVINPHPRFGALTKNIRVRRGRCFRYIILFVVIFLFALCPCCAFRTQHIGFSFAYLDSFAMTFVLLCSHRWL